MVDFRSVCVYGCTCFFFFPRSLSLGFFASHSFFFFFLPLSWCKFLHFSVRIMGDQSNPFSLIFNEINSHKCLSKFEVLNNPSISLRKEIKLWVSSWPHVSTCFLGALTSTSTSWSSSLLLLSPRIICYCRWWEWAWVWVWGWGCGVWWGGRLPTPAPLEKTSIIMLRAPSSL